MVSVVCLSSFLLSSDSGCWDILLTCVTLSRPSCASAWSSICPWAGVPPLASGSVLSVPAEQEPRKLHRPPGPSPLARLLGPLFCIGNPSRGHIRSGAGSSPVHCAFFAWPSSHLLSERKLRNTRLHVNLLMFLLAVLSPQSFGREGVGFSFLSILFVFPTPTSWLRLNGQRQRGLPIAQQSFSPEKWSFLTSSVFSFHVLKVGVCQELSNHFWQPPFHSYIGELVPSLASVILFSATEPQKTPRHQSHVQRLVSGALQHTECVPPCRVDG